MAFLKKNLKEIWRNKFGAYLCTPFGSIAQLV